MHLLITGATGFIGKHVLLDALADNRITKVTVVGRHPPSLDGNDMAHVKTAIINKLTIITREDLGNWDYEGDTKLVTALTDCKACVWCIGGKADDFATPQEFERVSYTFTVNAANFLCKVAQSQPIEGQTGRAAQPFRFCYCSTKGANRAGDGWFSFEAQTRNMKGRVETALLSIASESDGRMTAFVFRPGSVIGGATVKALGGLASTVASAGLRLMPSVVINAEWVARVLVDASVGIRVEWQRQGPDGDKNTWESEEIVSWSHGLGV
ncbi:hypothetical protein PAXINDRAFT_168784 [Paxillus involutus ATCC 200175]|uniref:NAD-dependent epimerase/dehydratase domain-containing protein n=1 Tax=Paxillus involutus ATCC 200175 TaxID=664439 RepID=A0A0C9TZE3_PAXIN|nr:hypothetical protein PAXINDRAFT_168784 [Paxillus involutus ATCC 200175]